MTNKTTSAIDLVERVARAIAAEVGRQDGDEPLDADWIADGIFKWNLVAQAALNEARVVLTANGYGSHTAVISQIDAALLAQPLTQSRMRPCVQGCPDSLETAIEPTQWGDEVAEEMRAYYEANCRQKWIEGTADNLMLGLLNIVLRAKASLENQQ